MLQPADIRRFCERKYPLFLASLVSGCTFFPLEVPFGRPGPRFEHAEMSRTISALAECGLGYKIEWTSHKYRWIGDQRVPKRIWFETAEDYLRAINKERETHRFIEAIDTTRRVCPALLPWIAKNPIKTAEHLNQWADVLTVVTYFLRNPRPQLYARELPIEISTKFVEENRSLLDAVLKTVLSESAVDLAGDSFERRFGLRYDEPLVRFRVLDCDLKSRLGLPFLDISVPVSQLSHVEWHDINVIIVENKLTFLTLPVLNNSLAIWGSGAAAHITASLLFLPRCRLLYWGDLDTHGFHIVSRLRSVFRSLSTVMMDLQTLQDHRCFQTKAREAAYHDTLMLTNDELAAYQYLESNRALLEQEKIPLSYATARLLSALASPACKELSQVRWREAR